MPTISDLTPSISHLILEAARRGNLPNFLSPYTINSEIRPLITPRSLKALEQLVEESSVVSEIQGVILLHNGASQPEGAETLIKNIFESLATNGNEVTLGVRRSHVAHHDGQAHDIEGYDSDFLTASEKMMQFLDRMITASYSTQLSVEKLVVDLEDTAQPRPCPKAPNHDDLEHIYQWAEDLALDDEKEYAWELRFHAKGSGGYQRRITFTDLDKERVEVDISRFWLFHFYLITEADVFAKLSVLTLFDCDIPAFSLFTKGNIKNLTLRTVHLWDVKEAGNNGNPIARPGDWIEVLEDLAKSSSLDVCCFNGLWNGKEDKVLGKWEAKATEERSVNDALKDLVAELKAS